MIWQLVILLLGSFYHCLHQDSSEGNNARDLFGGRLTPDFVAEKLGHSNFLDVREMDLPSAGIRIVDLGPGDIFLNLRRYTKQNKSMGKMCCFVYVKDTKQ